MVLVALLGLRTAYGDRALPGTRLAGANVGGDSRDELRERVERIASRAVIVLAADKRLRVEPAAAGLRIDVDTTVRHAMDAGRDGTLAGAGSTLRGLVSTNDVELAVRIDGGLLDGTVARLAQSVDRKPFPGAIEVDAEQLEAEAVAPRTGRELDRRDLRARLVRAFRNGVSEVRPAVDVTRVARMSEVEAVARSAQDYLDAPVVLTGAGDPLRLEASRIAPILRLSTLGSETNVTLGTSRKALEALVSEVAESRDRAARDAKISAPARSAIVEGKGDLSWKPKKADVSVTGEGRSGRKVDQAASVKAIDGAVRKGEHRVSLKVVKTKPAVSAAAARKVDRLIGTFTTRYTPGQPRVKNIRRMARTVDGTIVAPGAQFSLNGLVGPRTKEGGYVEAPFIADGKLEPSVGGGVSQFSTTLYNAAYFGGLKLDTHTPHSIFIDRYPPGRESTLNYDSIDLKWTNDTDAPVLIRTFTDSTSVTVTLYGDNGGRRVTAQTGERRPIPGEDFSIVVTRVVRYPGGRVAREPFTTRYDAPIED